MIVKTSTAVRGRVMMHTATVRVQSDEFNRSNRGFVDETACNSSCSVLVEIVVRARYFGNKDHGAKAHERAKGPMKLEMIPGISRHGIHGEARPRTQQLAVERFDEHLKGNANVK